jgi:lipoprotein-anchoring transpeptidase ErfK/SrfK
VLALCVGVLIGLTGCQSGGQAGGAQGVAPAGGSSATSSRAPAPTVTFSPAAGVRNARMDKPVTVTAIRGKLASVQVTTAKGTELTGDLDAAGTTWTSTGVLAADTSYTVTATTDADDATPATSTFRTLKPARRASMTLNVGDGQVVGVGLPIVARFLSPVKNHEAVIKALAVTTTPQVEGAWRAMPDNQFMWRPKEYWPPGTTVHVQADVGAVEVSSGVWGQRTYTSDFTIGPSVISTVDVKKLTLTYQQQGQPAKVMPVTTGRSTPDGKQLTRGGTKVIMEKGEWVRMVGTDPQDAYNVKVQWAMRLTNSGEYLHFRPDSERAGDFGVRNASHGCTGLSQANAKWLYDHSKIGDVVRYVNSKRPLDASNGWSVWQLSYQQWSTTSGV